MYYQEKVAEINAKLEFLMGRGRTVVWPCGFHTIQMFAYTDLSKYFEQLEFVDKGRSGQIFMGKVIKAPEEIKWDDVECVVVSTFGNQESILNTLKNEIYFRKRILTFYETDVREFYYLYDAFHGIVWGEEVESWEDAKKLCPVGYGDKEVLDAGIQEIKNWDKMSHCPNYFIVSNILSACMVYKQIILVDWGGALAQEYYRDKKFFEKTGVHLTWCVIDLKQYVDYGKRELETEHLKFYYDLKEVKEQYGENNYIICMRGSLQYISHYMDGFCMLKPKKIIIDDTPMAKKEHFVIQRVRDFVHGGNFAVCIYNESKFVEELEDQGYELECSEPKMEMQFSDIKAFYKRLVFQLKEE